MTSDLDEILGKVARRELSEAEAYESIRQLKARPLRPAGGRETTKFEFEHPILRDHQLLGERVLMGVVHCSLALDALKGRFPNENGFWLEKVSLLEAIRTRPGEIATVRIDLTESGDGFEFRSQFGLSTDQPERLSARGRVGLHSGGPAERIDLKSVRQGASAAKPGEWFYQHHTAYGPSLMSLQEALFLPEGILGEYQLPASAPAIENRFAIHPSLFDSAYVNCLCAVDDNFLGTSLWVPVFIRRVEIVRAVPAHWHCRTRVAKRNAEILVTDHEFYDSAGEWIGRIEGLTVKRVPDGLNVLPTSSAESIEPEPAAVPELAISDSLFENIQQYLTARVARLLGAKPDDFAIDKPFLEFGAESSSLIKLVEEIEREIGVELYPTLFFEYQTIRELSGHLEAEQSEKFNAYFSKQPRQATRAGTSAPRIVREAGPQLTVSSNATSVRVSREIAVIGMAGRFAGSKNLAEFWQHLRNGADLIQEIPSARWDWRRWFDAKPQTPHRSYCRWGSFLDDVDKFDPLFFNMSPREAQATDPQLRLLLEVMYEATEDAGYASSIWGSKTGLYVGSCFKEYWDEIVRQRIPITGMESFASASSFLANRPSFFFDLRGPSVSIDDACSSSLIALHLACKSLQSGECDMAFAAGLNVLLSPLHFVYFSALGALSPTGRCHSFEKSADGYVPGEGIAALLLKPLDKAIQDRDIIHAVIKGSAMNHGGRANNPTSPRTQLETEVIQSAWADAGIPPETIGYLEAHGTGTLLGDPIETDAVKKAFQSFTQRRAFCALGSVKANIGHTEGAAGLAGVIKLILSMQHGEIPAMPQFHEINPYLRLENSPLYINRELQAWPAPKEHPRRGGVSSFGMGGAYAHVVVDEYRDARPVAPVRSGPNLFLLSALTPERLVECAKKFEARLAESPEVDFQDLCYTLQTGRQALDHRLALLVGSSDDARSKLREFIRNQNGPGIFLGKAGDAAKISADEINRCLRPPLYEKLAALWISGAKIPWATLYGAALPRRISLPTYPFAKKRYWLPPTGLEGPEVPNAKPLDPLIDSIVPRFDGAEFAKRFMAGDSLVRDHVISGETILPGVVHVELARAAAQLTHQTFPAALERVVWRSPIRVPAEGKEVRVVLEKDQIQIRFAIRSGTEIHTEGEVRFGELAPPPPNFDLAALQASCRNELAAPDVYARFEKMGICYGPTLRVIDHVWFNSSEALSRIAIPAGSDSASCLALDGLFQTAIGLFAGSPEPLLTLVPFAADAIDFFGEIQHATYAHVRRIESSTRSSEVCLDFALLDETGAVRLQMRNVRLKPLKSTDAKSEPEKSACLFYLPRWKFEPLPGAAGSRSGRIVIFRSRHDFGLTEKLAKAHAGSAVTVIHLGKKFDRLTDARTAIDHRKQSDFERVLADVESIGTIYFLGALQPFEAGESDLAALAEAQELGVLSLLRLVKALGPDRAASLKVVTNQAQTVGDDRMIVPSGALAIGLAKVIAREFPNLQVSCVDLCPNTADPGKFIVAESGLEAAIRNGKRFICRLSPVELGESGDRSLPIRTGGVYVIVGGTGGLGLALAEFLGSSYQARLALISRRPPNEQQEKAFAALRNHGAEALHIQADVTDLEAMRQAASRIREKFGPVHGVIHAALSLEDRSIVRMDEETFRAVLAPKVQGSFVLSESFQDEKLDFLVFFSSANSFLATAGQSNYVAGSAFQDAYGKHLARDRHQPVTVINWGLWGDIGIVARAGLVERISRQGIHPISPAQGIDQFKRILTSRAEQIVSLNIDKAVAAPALFDFGHTFELTTAVAARADIELAAARAEAASTREATWDEAFSALEQFGIEKILGQLREWGAFTAESPVESLPQTLGIEPKYQRLWQAILAMLRESGAIATETGRLVPTRKALRAPALDEIRKQFPEVRSHLSLLEACLGAFREIVTGNILATEVLFPNSSMESVERIYAGNPIADHFNSRLAALASSHVAARIGGAASEKPIRILELGAGTGGTSQQVLEAISRWGGQLEYVYTDVSGGFLQHGRRVFGSKYPFVRFESLDVERPPEEQGFAGQSFDLVIAANVLHATRRMGVSLDCVKRLLKQNGVLVLNELTGRTDFATMTFGLLDGWWAFEDAAWRIPNSPLLSVADWRLALGQAGFRNVAVRESFACSHAHFSQSLVTSASDGLMVKPEIVESGGSKESRPARSNASELTSAKPAAEVVRLVTEQVARTLQLEPDELDPSKRFSEYGVDSLLSVDLINRLNKTLGLRVKTTVLFDYSSIDDLAGYLARELEFKSGAPSASMKPASPAASPRTGTPYPGPTAIEFATPASSSPRDGGAGRGLRRGESHENRPPLPSPLLQEWRRGRDELGAFLNSMAVHPGPIPAGFFRAVQINGPGSIDDIQFVELPVPEPGEFEVQISVRACSLNFGDLLCVRGLYPTMPDYPFVPGFEVAGTVLRIGPGVTRFRPGDAVIALMGARFGGQADIATADEDFVVNKPAPASFEEAAAFPVVFLTAHHALEKAALQPGDKILIQTAAGGTGLVAVQLAQRIGAEIFATAGSQQKLDYLKRLGVAHAINYRTEDFAERIRELTAGYGVDVVLNTLSGDAVQKGLELLAPGGRYVDLAMTGIRSATSLNLAHLRGNQSIHCIDLLHFFKTRPELLRPALETMADHLAQRAIGPTVAKVFAFSEIKEAYRFLDSRQNIGKVLVTIPRPASEVIQNSPVAVAVEDTHRRPAVRDIAIIGRAGRFPGAADLDEFWLNLAGGKSAIIETPSDRWSIDEFYDPNPAAPNRTMSKWGGFLSGIDQFDPLFFSLSGHEAERMDPQQRLFLEESWKALEDAGYSSAELSGKKCGLFVGVSAGDYADRLKESGVPMDGFVFTGNQASILAGRLAYLLNLKGPALAIDTACSSSLVAVHLACQSIAQGESELALAGGVFINTTAAFHILCSKAGMLSPKGQCRAFDQAADGFVPGEGVGAILLKPLDRALADGDHIYAVIKGSGINQDGKTNGITAPSSLSQTALECDVYDRAEINPETIQCLEAHGTGTKLGDPIEIDALTAAFRKYTARTGFCAVGSVKTNIGHAATAAGIASVLKVLLALEHRQIPPSLNFEHANEQIAFSETPFFISRELQPWKQDGPRRAAVSSFGFSGTNGHLVLEEAPAQSRRASASSVHLICLSARTENALRRKKEDLVRWLEARPDGEIEMADVAFTLNRGRAHFEKRFATVAGNRAELLTALRTSQPPREEGASVAGSALDLIQQIRASSAAADRRHKLGLLAAHYLAGTNLDWESFYRGESFRRISLPTYPFERNRYWVPEDSRKVESTAEPALHPFIKANVSGLGAPRFAIDLSESRFAWKHHLIAGRPIIPATVYLEIARAAAALAGCGGIKALQNVAWFVPLSSGNREAFISLHREDSGIQFKIHSGTELHARGICVEDGKAAPPSTSDPKALCQKLPEIRDEIYDAFTLLDVDYGETFQLLQQLWSSPTEAIGRVVIPAERLREFEWHPCLLDAALQTSLEMVRKRNPAGLQPFVPASLESLAVYGPFTAECFVHATLRGSGEDSIKVDFEISDNSGRALATLKGMTLQKFRGGGPALIKPAAQPAPRAEMTANSKTADRSPTKSEDPGLLQKSEAYLRQLLAAQLKIDASAFGAHEPFEKFGIDSMMITTLNGVLEKEFGPLSKTLFFEYQNLRELAGYFAQEHRAKFDGSEMLAPNGISQPDSHEALGSAERIQAEASTVEPAARNGAAEHDIAIVGMSGRFPLAPSVQAFWENLSQGRDCITEIPAERWTLANWFDPDKTKEGSSYCKWGGFIDGVDKFDPLFFKISPQEAELMDPQERLFLETAWATLEDAGYTRETLRASARQPRGKDVGVFVGVMWGDYQLYGAGSSRLPQLPWSAYWSIANRVSYFFNFQGPSLALDTACSSSLVAIHLACESLRRGECKAALAGGVNVSVHPNKYLHLSQMKFASSEGRCRSFGEGGDGYVPGEGVGAILLKPLSAAIADRDQIYGIIKGSAVNHGGKTNGYSVPNPNAQGDLIAAAIDDAKIDPRTIGYIEAHGTGTALGDPIEVTGLTRAFREFTEAKQFCALGSVKSHIGHLESAAGIAAVIKVLLQMKHRKLAPSLHASTINANIRFEETPFWVQRELSDWQSLVLDGKEYPRRAGISSFGAGGTNAHLIVEEHGPEPLAVASAQPELIVLSAKNDERLAASARNLKAFLETANGRPPALADLAYTLQIGREQMEARLAFVAANIDEVKAQLDAFSRGLRENIWVGQAPSETAAEPESEEIEYLAAISRNRRLEKVAAAWVEGKPIDFSRLHVGKSPRRISLPTYPFEKKRCWVGPSIESNESLRQPMSPVALPPDLFYETAWVEAPLDPPNGTAPLEPKAILLFDSDAALFASLKDRKQNVPIIRIEPSDRFEKIRADLYLIRPSAEADYQQLLSELQRDGIVPSHIAWLWNYRRANAPVQQETPSKEVLQVINTGLQAVFFLAKALQQSSHGQPLHWLYLIRGGDSFSQAQEFAVSGFLRAFVQENRQCAARCVEIIDPSIGESRLGQIVLDEWAQPAGDPEVRFAGQLRWARRVRPCAQETPATTPAFRVGGVYLVTGGLGELGFLISKFLIERFQARIVLTGRSELTQAKRERLDQLRALGGEATYHPADLGNRSEVSGLVEATRRKFGDLHGVLHLACVVDDGLIFRKEAQSFQNVLRPKIAGALFLDEATREMDLDLFLMFSSVVSITGNAGQGDYCAACRFQDLFAERREELRQRGRRQGRTLTVAWSQWEKAGHYPSLELLENLGVTMLSVGTGIAALLHAIQMERPFLIVIDGVKEKIHQLLGIAAGPSANGLAANHRAEAPDLFSVDLAVPSEIAALDEKQIDALLARLLEQNGAPVLASANGRVKADPEKIAPERMAPAPSRSLDALARTLQKRLKIELGPGDFEKPFSDFGLDSISAVKWADDLQKELGLQINPKWFWDFPTLEKLGTHLTEQLEGTLR